MQSENGGISADLYPWEDELRKHLLGAVRASECLELFGTPGYFIHFQYQWVTAAPPCTDRQLCGWPAWLTAGFYVAVLSTKANTQWSTATQQIRLLLLILLSFSTPNDCRIPHNTHKQLKHANIMCECDDEVSLTTAVLGDRILQLSIIICNRWQIHCVICLWEGRMNDNRQAK